MTNATQIAQNYIAAWNETDAAQRQRLVLDHWAKDAIYIDPMMQAAGHEQIAGLMGAVHERFPGFRFTLDGNPDGYGDKIRFSWMLGPQSEPDMIKGTDFAVVENGRLKSVTGFLDKVPAGA
ncbi:MAG: nuclear transport factor 2 family protein [Ottowia sp.]|uniref:nuclear transport factor 2 family protein n=1 Tax=unclassified Ottowia TaxID=2645081 RepID=UPI003C3056C7